MPSYCSHLWTLLVRATLAHDILTKCDPPIKDACAKQGHIRVAVRVRPLPAGESGIIEAAGDEMLAIRKEVWVSKLLSTWVIHLCLITFQDIAKGLVQCCSGDDS